MKSYSNTQLYGRKFSPIIIKEPYTIILLANAEQMVQRIRSLTYRDGICEKEFLQLFTFYQAVLHYDVDDEGCFEEEVYLGAGDKYTHYLQVFITVT